MQIRSCEVVPLELSLRHPALMAHLPEITQVTMVFVRLVTVQGQSAWGCAVAHPHLTGEEPAEVIRLCHDCAALAPDLHPTNLEYSLSHLSRAAGDSMGARCAFDIAFHDLLGLATGLPLYRLLGGYRNSIPTSVTIPLGSVAEGVSLAEERAQSGFRMFKIKGGLNPQEDVRRVRAIHRALPGMTLRLDADGGYTVQAALDVGRALEDILEMIEQPTPAEDLDALGQVQAQSPVPILADQSVCGPDSALALASQCAADGMCIKVARCGGLRCAAQVDAIARAAHMATMVSCVVEPALLVSAGLSFALGSPNVKYADLDGHFDLIDDPSNPAFKLEDGWLTASEVPGLGCWVDLG
jgi:L-Ala-D/L-Glu epimerase